MGNQKFSFDLLYQRYFIDKNQTFLLPLVFLLVAYFINRKKFRNDLRRDFHYWWFLINGVWIHLFLHGLVGYFGKIQPLVYMYFLLDTRYHLRDSIVMTITIVELLFMGPGCILISILYKTRQHFIREITRIIVSALQITGTVFFVVNEYGNKFRNVCQGSCFAFTSENIFFFWTFFVLVNMVFFIIPLLQLYKGYQNVYILWEGEATETVTKKKKKKVM